MGDHCIFVRHTLHIGNSSNVCFDSVPSNLQPWSLVLPNVGQRWGQHQTRKSFLTWKMERWSTVTSFWDILGTSSVLHIFHEMIPLSLRMASVMVWGKWLFLQMRRNLLRRRGLWRCVECIEISKSRLARISKFFLSDDRVTCSMWLLWPTWIINRTSEDHRKISQMEW